MSATHNAIRVTNHWSHRNPLIPINPYRRRFNLFYQKSLYIICNVQAPKYACMQASIHVSVPVSLRVFFEKTC